jgi:hypothetical protein
MSHLTSDKKSLVETPAPLLFEILHCKDHKKNLVQETVQIKSHHPKVTPQIQQPFKQNFCRKREVQ